MRSMMKWVVVWVALTLLAPAPSAVWPADLIGPEDVVGHSDVAPSRKVDPGPLYPWDQVLGRPGGKQIPPAPSAVKAGVVAVRPAAPRLLYLTRPRLTGPDVQEVLIRLRDLGYYGGELDSTYGPMAEAAVYWFQADKGLGYDGVVGPLTLAALRK